MKRLEHIGIAVKDLDEANALFERLLGVPHYKTEEVEREGVLTSFFNVGGVKIELLQATRPDSAIATFIEKRGEGLHHLAFEVDTIDDSMKNLNDEGFQLLSQKPFPGADNKMVAFLHPRSTQRVLVELCQERSPQP